LADGIYTSNGILILNGQNVGLQVSNNEIIGGNLTLTGANSEIVTPYLTVLYNEHIRGNSAIDGTLTANNLVLTGTISGEALSQIQQTLLDDSFAISIALS
jgi:hypothetical protein